MSNPEFSQDRYGLFIHPVYMPDGYDIDDVKKILSDYNQLVDVTESVEFNPYVFSFGKYKKEFDLFFN